MSRKTSFSDVIGCFVVAVLFGLAGLVVHYYFDVRCDDAERFVKCRNYLD